MIDTLLTVAVLSNPCAGTPTEVIELEDKVIQCYDTLMARMRSNGVFTYPSDPSEYPVFCGKALKIEKYIINKCSETVDYREKSAIIK